MTNYVKFTNFTVKDSLPTGDTNKVIRGSEFDTEFDAIATAVSTKSNIASPTFTGTATFDGLTATGTVDFSGGNVTTNIDGGTIDGVIIGGSTPAAISGTTGTFSGVVTGSNLNVSNWDTAFGWGDHSTEGYLTSVTLSDIDAGAITTSSETFADSDTQIPTNAAVRNWVLTTYPTIVELNDLTANVTWANVPDANITESSVTQHEAALSINTSQISGGLSLSDITDVTATATEVNYTDGVTSNIQTQLDSKVGATHTGDVDITGELLVDSYNETFKAPSPSATTNPFDFDAITATGNTVNVQTNGAGDQPVGNVYWKPDGTVFWVHDHDNTPGDRIYQYTLSTAWDLSTASYDTYLSSTTAFGVQNVTFGVTNDGTVLIGTPRGSGTSVSRKITLTTAWDIGGGYTNNGTGDAITNFDYGYSLQIKNDGTKLWALNDGGEIHQWSFGTAFDHTTLSYDSKSFTPGGTQDRSFEFNSDGTKIYVSSSNGQAVNEYTLSTAYDISTANSTATNTYAVGFNVALIGIDPDGSKLYLVRDALGFTVTEYDFDSAANGLTIDCESGNVFSHTLSANTIFTFSNPPASGTPVVSGYQLSSAAYASKSFSVASQETAPRAVEFKSDGTKMYVLGSISDTVFQYALSTAWDVSTASYESKSFSVASEQTVPDGIRFKPDGTKFYIIGDTPDSVHQYSMSTAWDISTASYDSVTFSVSSQLSQATGLFFKSDGLSLYAVGAVNDTVYQYTLSTAWDLSTASYASKSFSVASQATFPTDVNFNNDGTKMFVQCLNTDFVYQYSLSTAWDVSTASYDSVSFSTGSQEVNPYACTFGDSGTKMYVVGNSGDTVYQYSTSTSSLNDSTAYAMSLKVVQDADASGYTVTWPTSVDWPSATAPTLTATASAVDQFVFYTYDGGTTWYGFTAGQALG
jgi:hypothetical protein